MELDSFKREKEAARAQNNQEEYRRLEQIIALLSRADAVTSATEKVVNYQKKRGPGGWGDPLPPLQSFYYPITHEIMEEPVEIASGQIYERTAIEKWFSAGNSNCPMTKVELENLQIKLNLALWQSIQEWKERNIAISIAATKPKLQSGVEVEHNRDQIAAAGAIKLVVKSLARDVGEGRQAVALLRDLSKDPEVCEKIGKVQGRILLLVTMLNAENSHAVADARELLYDLANNDQNVVQMGEANYFGPLTQRLNEGPNMTKILMASALSRLGLTDQSKAAFAQQGAIPPLVKMISVGKLEAKAAALGALKNLATLPANRETMIETGVISPLLQLLFSETSVAICLKENAAATLSNIAMASTSLETKINNHGNILESDETLFQLLYLVNRAGPVIQGHLLRAFLGMSSIPNARGLRSKMREGGAIQLLLPLCESPTDEVRIDTLKLLNSLSSDGAGKDLADYLGPTYIKSLVKLLVYSSRDEERIAAVGIISNLPMSNTHMTELLLQADALQAIVNLLFPSKGLKSGARAVRHALTESAAGALLHFTSPENIDVAVFQQKAAGLDAIPRLVQLLQTGTPLAKCRAATALATSLSAAHGSLRKTTLPSRAFSGADLPNP